MYNGAGIYKGGMTEAQVRELMLNTIGGRTYKTTKIGNQIWLAENLDFKFYGLGIGTEAVSMSEPNTACAVYYNDDEATYGVNGNKYGLLYNWYAVRMLKKYKDQLIPGWHVPSYTELNALITTVGGSFVAGTKLKSKTGWSSGAGTDDFGFTAFPAGRYDGGSFSNLGSQANFWTSSEASSSNARFGSIDTSAYMSMLAYNKSYCFSVRLVRDA